MVQQKRTKKKKGGDSNNVTLDATHPGFNRSFDRRLRLDNTQLKKALQKRDDIPKFNGGDKDICINFHLRGGCRMGDECPRADSHQKLNNDTAKQLKEWRKAALE